MEGFWVATACSRCLIPAGGPRRRSNGVAMRSPNLIRAVVTAGAVAVLSTGCLSSGASSGGSAAAPSGQVKGSTVTVWASVDLPVMNGLKAGMAPLAQAAGVTVNWQKVDNINQVIMTKI